jgi:hypothetical protein
VFGYCQGFLEESRSRNFKKQTAEGVFARRDARAAVAGCRFSANHIHIENDISP